MLSVSDPQPRFDVDKLSVHKYVMWLRNKGLDVHEFATSYVNRTAELGYAPNLDLSVQEFMREAA